MRGLDGEADGVVLAAEELPVGGVLTGALGGVAAPGGLPVAAALGGARRAAAHRVHGGRLGFLCTANTFSLEPSRCEADQTNRSLSIVKLVGLITSKAKLRIKNMFFFLSPLMYIMI